MDIETKGLGAGSYPEPNTRKENDVDITIYVTYKIKNCSFPYEYTKEDIIDVIKENWGDYTNSEDMEDYEIDI